MFSEKSATVAIDGAFYRTTWCAGSPILPVIASEAIQGPASGLWIASSPFGLLAMTTLCQFGSIVLATD
jgi:hypothetical protein